MKHVKQNNYHKMLLNKTTDPFVSEFMGHSDALYNFAISMTKHREQAEDLVQETLLKAFRYKNHYQMGTNAKSWLFRIAQNLFINDYRKKLKRPSQVDFEDVLQFNMLKDKAPNAFDNSFSDPVALALNSLPIDLKTIIVLSDIESFSYEEISKILDLKSTTKCYNI